MTPTPKPRRPPNMIRQTIHTIPEPHKRTRPGHRLQGTLSEKVGATPHVLMHHPSRQPHRTAQVNPVRLTSELASRQIQNATIDLSDQVTTDPLRKRHRAIRLDTDRPGRVRPLIRRAGIYHPQRLSVPDDHTPHGRFRGHAELAEHIDRDPGGVHAIPAIGIEHVVHRQFVPGVDHRSDLVVDAHAGISISMPNTFSRLATIA